MNGIIEMIKGKVKDMSPMELGELLRGFNGGSDTFVPNELKVSFKPNNDVDLERFRKDMIDNTILEGYSYDCK